VPAGRAEVSGEFSDGLSVFGFYSAADKLQCSGCGKAGDCVSFGAAEEDFEQAGTGFPECSFGSAQIHEL
jgi:hypothetical protein